MKAAPQRAPSTACPDKQGHEKVRQAHHTCTRMHHESPEATRPAHHFWALLGTHRALQTCRRTEVNHFTTNAKRMIPNKPLKPHRLKESFSGLNSLWTTAVWHTSSMTVNDMQSSHFPITAGLKKSLRKTTSYFFHDMQKQLGFAEDGVSPCTSCLDQSHSCTTTVAPALRRRPKISCMQSHY